MSAYTSLTLSRAKALEIIRRKVDNADDEQLARMVSRILEEDTLYNCYQVVGPGMENDDDRLY